MSTPRPISPPSPPRTEGTIVPTGSAKEPLPPKLRVRLRVKARALGIATSPHLSLCCSDNEEVLDDATTDLGPNYVEPLKKKSTLMSE